jgi:hypothetical protein
VKRPKVKQAKRKPGEPVQKPGPASWIWGTKLKFFEARKEDWVKASEGKLAGDFYTKMAKLYTAKYGYDMADGEDFQNDVADPPDWVANHVANEKLPENVTKAHQAVHAKLKEVNGVFIKLRCRARSDNCRSDWAAGTEKNSRAF